MKSCGRVGGVVNTTNVAAISRVMPVICRLMEAFDTPITRALPEYNLDELLQVTYHSVACKELQRRSKVDVPPLAYARPPGLFGPAVHDASVVA